MQTKEIVQKIVSAIKQDPELKQLILKFGGILANDKIDGVWEATFNTIDRAARNRLFENYPHKFGITEAEGQILRVYFSRLTYPDEVLKFTKDLILWGLLSEEWPMDRSTSDEFDPK